MGTTGGTAQYTRYRCNRGQTLPPANPGFVVPLLVACADLGFIFGPQTALRQKQAPQAPQIIQNSPAAGDMEIAFGEVVGNQEERLFTAVRTILLSRGDFLLDIAPGFVHSLGKHANIFVRPLDIIKRRFGILAHIPPFRPTALAGGPCK